MSLSNKRRVQLKHIPDIKKLLFKAAFRNSRFGGAQFDGTPSLIPLLPNTEFYFDSFKVNDVSARSFHQVVAWDANLAIIHPCYLHKLAFPLHIMLLLSADFPFPLIGLVHVSNKITQYRAIKSVEDLSVSCSFGKIEAHSKGWLFSINVIFYIAGEVVWKSTSTNLFRTKHDFDLPPKESTQLNFVESTNFDWQLNSNLGYQYARASGDFNPIHLTKLLAKLFGFRQHIIHGMWTKSRCISTIQQCHYVDFSQSFTLKTEFKQPLYLPNKVNMSIEQLDLDAKHRELQFKVQSVTADPSQTYLHLTGNIQTL